jgi:hypothetical protein
VEEGADEVGIAGPALHLGLDRLHRRAGLGHPPGGEEDQRAPGAAGEQAQRLRLAEARGAFEHDVPAHLGDRLDQEFAHPVGPVAGEAAYPGAVVVGGGIEAFEPGVGEERVSERGHEAAAQGRDEEQQRDGVAEADDRPHPGIPEEHRLDDAQMRVGGDEGEPATPPPLRRRRTPPPPPRPPRPASFPAPLTQARAPRPPATTAHRTLTPAGLPPCGPRSSRRAPLCVSAAPPSPVAGEPDPGEVAGPPTPLPHPPPPLGPSSLHSPHPPLTARGRRPLTGRVPQAPPHPRPSPTFAHPPPPPRHPPGPSRDRRPPRAAAPPHRTLATHRPGPRHPATTCGAPTRPAARALRSSAGGAGTMRRPGHRRPARGGRAAS